MIPMITKMEIMIERMIKITIIIKKMMKMMIVIRKVPNDYALAYSVGSTGDL